MGLSPAEAVGRSAFELFRDVILTDAEGRTCSVEDAWRRALAGEPVRGECTIGVSIYDFRLLPWSSEDGHEPAGVVGVATDVTQRVRADRSRQEAMAYADRLRAVSTLAAGTAHEINNPLTYALINVEHVLRRLRILVASDALPEASSELAEALPSLVAPLSQALEGMSRVRQIVRNLTTFSAGSVESHTLLDVRSIVESSLQLALHEVEPRARLVRQLAEVPPIDADEARLGQALLNLILNAAQAIPEDDSHEHCIRVATYTDGQTNAVIEVSDTGVGISPDALPRIFDPFFTSKPEGVGMGLSIAHGTIRRLGGEITVRSTPGSGSTFRVVLPAARRWRASSPPSAPASGPVVRRRVLVVDDDSLVGEALARALGADADVETATDASTVLARLRAGERWDLVLCDLLMPGMTGMDLYARVLRAAPDATSAMAFMTGGAHTARARAFIEGVHAPVFEKPLDLAKLRSVIGRAG
jgi:signal transduction histidine kinase